MDGYLLYARFLSSPQRPTAGAEKTHRMGMHTPKRPESPGFGKITGLVYLDGTPDTLASRPVRLYLDKTGTFIAETRSDPVTGEYEFRGVALGVPFTAYAVDDIGELKPVASDKLYADPM